MGLRAALIRDWRQSLQADEAQLDSAVPRSAWLLRARARIYRVLLAMYGHGDWRADCPDTQEAAFHAVPLAPGRPPKSLAEIRKTLKAVRSAVDAPPAGEPTFSRESVSFLTSTGLAIVCSSLQGSELCAASNSLQAQFIDIWVQGEHILVKEADRERALGILMNDRRIRSDLRNRALEVNNRTARFHLISFLCLLTGSFATFAIIPRLRSPQNWHPTEIAAAYFAASAFWVAAVLCLNAARKRWR